MWSKGSPITESHRPSEIGQNEQRRNTRRERTEAKVEATTRRKSIGIVKRRRSTDRDQETVRKRRKTRTKKDKARTESTEEVKAVPNPDPKNPKNSAKNPQPQKVTPQV